MRNFDKTVQLKRSNWGSWVTDDRIERAVLCMDQFRQVVGPVPRTVNKIFVRVSKEKPAYDPDVEYTKVRLLLRCYHGLKGYLSSWHWTTSETAWPRRSGMYGATMILREILGYITDGTVVTAWVGAWYE